MEISRLRSGDEQLAIAAAISLKSEAEREGYKPSLQHMRALLAQDENYLIVAADNGVPLGFLIAYQMPMLARDASMVYLYEIGVAAEYLRQGIATQMINLLKTLCQANAVVEMWVGTDNDNIAAKRLYSSTGGVLESDGNAEFIYTLESSCHEERVDA